MTGKPLRCRLGLHANVQQRPDDEQLHGPDQKVCRLCGKRSGTPFGAVPPGGVGGGP